MSDANRKDAKTHAERAGRQARSAAKNTTRAAKAAAKIAAEAAGDKVEEVEDAADEAVEAVDDAVRPAIKTGTQLILSPLGKAAIGYTIAVLGLAYAAKQTKLMGVAKQAALETAAKADHHIRPSG